jgi:nicotinamide-nucleotide amidase
MDAEIIAVGSEMLTPQKIDTNSLYLTEQLNALGVEVVQKSIIGDDRARLACEIAAALKRTEIVILSGGLGPTEDDVTRDASASALGRGQTFRQDICDEIAARFARMKRSMAENNKRQAQIIDGAEVLPNDRGTAPGQWIEQDGRILFLLPGPQKN